MRCSFAGLENPKIEKAGDRKRRLKLIFAVNQILIKQGIIAGQFGSRLDIYFSYGDAFFAIIQIDAVGVRRMIEEARVVAAQDVEAAVFFPI